MPSWLAIATGAVIGALCGSFANVCACRIPRGESVVWPPSHCLECQATIRFYDNIPVVSWCVLRGKCRTCKNAIPLRHLLVEAGMGVIGALAGWFWGG